MPTPAQLKKDFAELFGQLARHRQRYDVWSDFLELAVCAIRKTTLPPGEAADAIEAQYMAVVAGNEKDDIRKMPELLGITALAIQDGGCDFLGEMAGELELLNSNLGQFFTPYSLSRMIAEMNMDGVGEAIASRGFVTVQEPACGAGGMIIAVADVIQSHGFDIGTQLYVDATDLSPMAWKMAYLQSSFRGIPATIRRGNTLSLEMFDQAVTPAFLPFYMRHREAFETWCREAAIKPVDAVAARTSQPVRPSRREPEPAGQLRLFE